MCGATNFRIVGPTAVVTTFAPAISSITSSGCVALLIARKPVTTVSRPPSPTSCTVYSETRVDRIDERCGDIREHQLVAALVQQQSDEAAPDVARAEVDGLHQTPAADTSAYSSSGLSARLRFSTSSSSEKRIAICDRISRCSSPLPAMPTTNVTGSPPQSTPPS